MQSSEVMMKTMGGNKEPLENALADRTNEQRERSIQTFSKGANSVIVDTMKEQFNPPTPGAAVLAPK